MQLKTIWALWVILGVAALLGGCRYRGEFKEIYIHDEKYTDNAPNWLLELRKQLASTATTNFGRINSISRINIYESRLPFLDAPQGDIFPFCMLASESWVMIESEMALSIKPLPKEYIFCRAFSEGLAAVTVQDIRAGGRKYKSGYIDKSGALVVPANFDCAYEYSEGLAVVGIKKNDKMMYGAINSLGEFVISPEFTRLFPFRAGKSSGLLRTPDGLRSVIIDNRGKIIHEFPNTWEIESSFCDGLALVLTWDGYLFVDESLSIALNLKRDWDEVHPFSCGVAPVRKGQSWGYINRKGEVVVPVIYKSALAVVGGVGVVEK